MYENIIFSLKSLNESLMDGIEPPDENGNMNEPSTKNKTTPPPKEEEEASLKTQDEKDPDTSEAEQPLQVDISDPTESQEPQDEVLNPITAVVQYRKLQELLNLTIEMINQNSIQNTNQSQTDHLKLIRSDLEDVLIYTTLEGMKVKSANALFKSYQERLKNL